ncbi:MAG: hypothetical protein KDD47_02335 [Acidobacteria bacterium]|nr:hypothetical protein [Acidobacteriota bacterium]
MLDLATSISSLPTLALLTLLLVTLPQPALAGPAQEGPSPQAVAGAREALLARYGEGEKERIEKGLAQVTSQWRAGDGDDEAFRAFVEGEFLPQGPELETTFERLEFLLERTGGYFTSMVRDLRQAMDLDTGPLLSIDHRMAGYEPGAHLIDDLFTNQLAFVALLNFPAASLEERLASGMGWSRERWAQARLTQTFNQRVPAEVGQRIAEVMAASDAYIADYNIYMHHLLTEDGRRLFPEGLRLITHWGLRDELKARYADTDGLDRQRLIQRVMERIVRQEIPRAVINSPAFDWQPESNRVQATNAAGEEVSSEHLAEREPDTRYFHWLEIFRAQRLQDPYRPDNPSHIARRFNVDREIPEAEVESLFKTVLDVELARQVGSLIEERLSRPLEPFDIWYVGFKPRGSYDEATLDAATRKRYPTAAAYAEDIPRILEDLGFSAERARFLAQHIVVDPSRGAGHAFGATRRDDQAHLRTRVGQDGMDYKGYNIAVHEMGHNVEQVFSVTTIDHTLLQGVPSTAFTEALAFVFQNRDLELLGLEEPNPAAEHWKALDTYWNAREISGVALVDMAAWRWLYDHPEATPAEFREAVVGIAREVWNRYFAPVFGVRDQTLLAVYSHLVDGAMYIPDYPLGHLISFQIEEHFKKPGIDFGEEFEKLCRQGRLTPDAWMRQGLGSPLSAEPLLEAARGALATVTKP